MLTISIEDKRVDTARLFGDVEQVVEEALRTYLIEQCEQQINQAAIRITTYQEKYGDDYHSFKQSIQTDEDFLMKVEQQNPLWEEDAMEWDYWLEEQKTWRDRLDTILRR